ncbi:hypothetical protein B0H34DRAFT_547996 [Crassisporium funariophilum]|nr:hypothetical protein B0H34DRAFT_547996 [Crassisporium funariophilum]
MFLLTACVVLPSPIAGFSIFFVASRLPPSLPLLLRACRLVIAPAIAPATFFRACDNACHLLPRRLPHIHYACHDALHLPPLPTPALPLTPLFPLRHTPCHRRFHDHHLCSSRQP